MESRQLKDLVTRVNRNTGLLRMLTADVDESTLRSPLGKSNSMLWITGHIALHRLKALQLVGPAVQQEPWEADFDRGAPKKHDLTVGFDQVAKLFEDRGAALASAIEHLDPSRLDDDTGREMPDGTSSLGGVLSFLIFHEVLHLGQIDVIKVGLGGKGLG